MLNNKILVIDDEQIIIDSIREDLRKENCIILSAMNGKEGLDIFEKEQPVLIILDLRMPVMDGIEFLEHIKLKTSDPYSVIVLTGHGDDENIEKCFGLGVSSFLSKPYNIHVLRGMVRHSIELKETQSKAEYLASFPKLNMNPVLEVDSFGTIPFYNNAAIEALNKLGLNNEDINVFLPDCMNEIVNTLKQKKGEPLYREVKIRDRIFLEDIHFVPEFNVVRIFARDVTDHRQAEEKIRKLSTAVEQSPCVVMISDTNGNIEYVNPRFTLLTGYTSEEVFGKNPRILQSGKTPPAGYKRLWETITSGSEWRGEFCNKKKNGELYWESVFISPVKNAEGVITHFIEIAEDITERRQTEERIHQLAYYDPLTGLPNRVLYNDRLSLALVHAQRTREMLAVLFLDLDRFKDINDTLGHSIGDQLLKTVARRMADSLRKEDTVTRLGGDEFTLLLPAMGQTEDVAGIAQKILEVVKKPLMLGGHELNITASIGIAIYPADGEDAVTLLKNADIAMYHAKEQGRNNYQFFTPFHPTRSVEYLETESSLHHALERDEFIVYYQPQVDMKTGRIVGSEALLRWQHPKLGLVEPLEFIGMSERNWLIVPIGEWALRTACLQNRALQDDGLLPLPVAVNLSAHQFQQENLVEMVMLALKETGMDPRFLALEITESTAMHNIESAAYKMGRLNRLGVHFIIDDLGTGYSSLRYLKTFPIYALKIDRSFVQDVVTDPNDAAIVTAIISMAKGLGLKVVAEGVETVAQLEFLRSLGCDEAQGYLFGKPMTAGEFKKTVEQDKHRRV